MTAVERECLWSLMEAIDEWLVEQDSEWRFVDQAFMYILKQIMDA